MHLAIDLGSTEFKAAVFDGDLQRAGEGHHPVKHRFGSGGEVELPVTEARSAVKAAIRAALTAADVNREAVQSIGITSQAQTFTILDASGIARTPFITWQDMRAEETCRAMVKSAELSDFGDHSSFGALLPVLQICLLKHLQQSDAESIGPDGLVVSLPTFFVRKWTGAFRIDENLAAMTGLYSLRDRRWWPEALAACRVDEAQLPEVGPIGCVAGNTGADALEYGLPEGVPVVLAGNDQTSGAYGAGIHESRALLITLGTAQAVYMCVRELPQPGENTVRGPYPGARFYSMAADSCGGSIVNWACQVLSLCGSPKEFFTQAEKSSRGANGLVFQPDLPSGKGRWENIAFRHTTADFARSIVESLVERMAGMVQSLGEDAQGRAVVAAGGGRRSRLWVELLAARLGTDIAAEDADPLVGAGRLALEAVGGAV